MRVLVTGAAGQVGRALIETAPGGLEIAAATHAELDVADAAAVARFVETSAPDLIVNAAAYTAVDRAESEPEAARKVNALGARHLAAAAAARGGRMIQLSTDFVFDGESTVPYAPDAEPAPLGVYGASKLAGERAVLETLPAAGVVLRTAWVYAPAGRNFVLTMLRLMRERGSVRVVTDQIGSPTAAASIAGAVWAIAARPPLHGICHWTDAGVASRYDFAVAIAEDALASGLLSARPEVVPITTEECPTPARRPRYSVLDTRSTVAALGLAPAHWRANLRGVLEEMQRG